MRQDADFRAMLGAGRAFMRVRRAVDAERCFRHCLALQPDSIDVRGELAVALATLGRAEDAERELRRILEQVPHHAEAHYNLGVLLERRGARDAALRAYGEALASAPAHQAARMNRGALALAAAQPETALADFDHLWAAGARTVETAHSRTRALFALHRDEEALDSADGVLAMDAGDARAWLDKIGALASLGRLEEAEQALRGARERIGERLFTVPRGPRAREDLDLLAIFVARALERNGAGQWQGRERLIEVLRESARAGRTGIVDAGAFIRVLALPLEESEVRLLADALARKLRARAPAPAHGARPASSQSRIRVGFLTPEVRHHHAAFILRRLFQHRDRARFEYFLYSLSSSDGSEIRRELERSVDVFVDVSSLQTAQLAARMREDDLDLLIDRTGYFAGSRPEVLASRVAPIQAGFMGTPSTLGEGLLDYRLTDELTTPRDAQALWPERLVFMPPPYVLFDAELARPQLRPRAAYGLPERGTVLCYFDLHYKIGPEVFRAWMSILQAVPDATLWLVDGGGVANGNLRRNAVQVGVDPRRLVFAPAEPYEAHFDHLLHADLFLDTFFYSARSLAFDALNAGVPVLTWPGRSTTSRLAYPFVHQLGLMDLVARDPGDYVQRAIHLATDAPALDSIKARVRQARHGSAVFDTEGRVKAVEQAFIAMVERHRAGLPPDTLVVE